MHISFKNSLRLPGVLHYLKNPYKRTEKKQKLYAGNALHL